MATDPNVLIDRAKCIDCQIPPGMLLPVLIALIDGVTGSAQDCVIPPAPVLTSSRYVGGAVLLAWTQAQDPPYGFVIHYGQTSGGPYTYSLSVPDGSARINGSGPYGVGTWYFVITAKGSSSNCESPNSNELSVIVTP